MNKDKNIPKKLETSAEENQAIASFLKEALWNVRQAQELFGDEPLFHDEGGREVVLSDILDKTVEAAEHDFEMVMPNSLSVTGNT